MKTKRITIIILTLILIFSLVFLSACLRIMDAANYFIENIVPSIDQSFRELTEDVLIPSQLSEKSKKEIDKAITEAEIEMKEEELIEGFEDYPDEPITYKGIIGDKDFYIDLIVDFNNKEVSGVVYNDWEISYLAAEIKGSIDLFRYSIEADCYGYFVNKETDASEEVHMKINGYLSENLNNFSGSLVVEGFGTKSFTAQKQ